MSLVRRWRRGRMAVAVALLALALVAVDLSGVGPPSAAPARAATDPIDQWLEDLEADINALAAATPALAADASVAVDELFNAGWEFVFGTWCSMADPLQRAVNALDHAETIAPASVKPLVLAVSAEVFRLQAYVLSLSEVTCERPDVFHVDPQVKPNKATAVDEVDGTSMPIGAIADDAGMITEYVSNRILLETNDTAKVTAFITRFGGTKTDTVPAEAGTEGSLALHSIRMDPARLLTTSQLAADLEALDPGYSGEIFAASDQQTLRLLATTARAVREGYPAILDLVSRADDVASGVTREVPVQSNTPVSPVPWDPNAFNWPYMRDNVNGANPQDIEVTTAWQQLNRAGLLKPSINVGVIDYGFDPEYNRDFPNTTGFVSGAFTQPFGDGPGGKYHGTKTANAIAGRLDNGIGAAGPAGPVTNRLYTVDAGFSHTRSWVRGLRKFRFRDTSVRVISISLSVNPPHRLARLTGRGSMDRELKRIADDGALVFASAGNQGENVDAQRCTRVTNRCRERRLRMPCELSRVICVGGVDWNVTSKAQNSNWGATDVDIWGPYTVWAGQTRECPIPSPPAPVGSFCAVQRVNGTSFATPFVAGVAALIWTADPNQTKDQVWDRMWQTATQINSGNVSRIVHAGRAVTQAIPPPSIRITAPTPNQQFPGGAVINASATLWQGTKGPPASVGWIVGESNVGTGLNPTIRLPNGTWNILVIARWADGHLVGANVTVKLGP